VRKENAREIRERKENGMKGKMMTKRMRKKENDNLIRKDGKRTKNIKRKK
jgi:hypothetical protein